jgi:hypothetical protein
MTVVLRDARVNLVMYFVSPLPNRTINAIRQPNIENPSAIPNITTTIPRSLGSSIDKFTGDELQVPQNSAAIISAARIVLDDQCENFTTLLIVNDIELSDVLLLK